MVAASNTVTIPPSIINPVLNNLGMSQYPADPFFNGRLDEFFVYNYALNGTQIARLAANQPPPPTTPASISAVISGQMLTLSWPSNYIGSRLLVQTNHLAHGLSLDTNDWATIPASQQTNRVALPLDSTQRLEFYRLASP